MSLNSKFSIVSSKELIGEFMFDFDVQNSQFISSLNRYIVRGIELCNIDTYYKRCKTKIKTESNRAMLPCTAKYIEAIFVKKDGMPHIVDIVDTNFDAFDNKSFKYEYYSSAYIEDRVINFDDYDGSVYVIYKSLPEDKDGYVMFPDDAYLREALLYFIIHKLSLSGYKHKVINRKEAYEMWNRLYPQARNSVNFPTVHDIQSFTEMWNNPLKGDWYNNLFD